MIVYKSMVSRLAIKNKHFSTKEPSMLSDKMAQALNEQVNKEFYSAYLYLAMAAYFSDTGLSGFAQWMRSQAQEEVFHAMKFHDFVLERGAAATLKAIAEPQASWKSSLEAFENALEHERFVTKSIDELVAVAEKEKDNASRIFLQWFVTEQVEEEDSVGEVVNKLKLIGKDGSGLYMLDRELGSRVFTAPAEGE
jgi:ferritin